MKIAIIDTDLISRRNHRFPNLACMKLSSYYKQQGHNVILELTYNDIDRYDKVFVSKVFTDTYVPDFVLHCANVEYGGTGFFYDKALPLPDEIEHIMPDYHLYDRWAERQKEIGSSDLSLKCYTDYSIGYLTRGCFRQCEFCVNKNYKRVVQHSPLSEFYDPTRKKICLLDDNFLGCSNWKELLSELIATGKPFQFKQGLDERLLTDEKCEMLFSAKYDGDITFAFDNIADMPLIIEKLKLIRKYTDRQARFYLFTGFDRTDRWDADFWTADIIDLFTRIKVLMQFQCLPYVMWFNRYEESPYRRLYITIARWCNQPSIFKKKSLYEFAEMQKLDSSIFTDFVKHNPQADQYFRLKYSDYTNVYY